MTKYLRVMTLIAEEDEKAACRAAKRPGMGTALKTMVSKRRLTAQELRVWEILNSGTGD